MKPTLCIRLQVVLSYASWDADSFRVLRPQCQSNKRTLEEFTKRPLYPVLPTDCVVVDTLAQSKPNSDI